MRWGGWSNPRLRRWIGAAVLLLVVGLALHLVGGRLFDLAWLVLTIIAAMVLVVGTYRYQEPPEG